MYAVRWSRRYLKRLMSQEFTKWHGAGSYGGDCWTICGIPIPLAIADGTFVPETDDDLSKINCRNCLRTEVFSRR